MISLFRKIRKKALDDNPPVGRAGKPLKYLRYAIGEIVLVVIGILIALSINNWNEQRKQEETLDRIYEIVADDLKSDSLEVMRALDFMEVRKNIYLKILNDSLTRVEVEENDVVGSLLFDVRVVNIDKRGYNLLRNVENKANRNNDSLILKIINFYSNSIFYVEKIEKFITDDLVKTNDRYKSKSWYTNVMRDAYDDDYLNYMLTDQEFKNFCSFRYSLYYENYQPTIQGYQKGIEHFLEEIEKHLSKN